MTAAPTACARAASPASPDPRSPAGRDRPVVGDDDRAGLDVHPAGAGPGVPHHVRDALADDPAEQLLQLGVHLVDGARQVGGDPGAARACRAPASSVPGRRRGTPRARRGRR